MNDTDTSFNGWRNFETWNVVLWLDNDFAIHLVAQGHKTFPNPYLALRKQLEDSFNYMVTKDGISLYDPRLDIDAINEAIKEY